MSLIKALIPFLCLCIAISAAETVELSRDKKALVPVVIGEKASPATKALATEFASYLSRMSGAEFKVETGDGSAGISLGKLSDFPKPPVEAAFGTNPFEREDFLMRTHAKGVWLVGAADLAISHAAWEFLYKLGYRQFFPGENWEVVPPPRDLSISLDEKQSPAFHARRIWYNWGMWGYNNEPYKKWCERNRAVRGFELNSGHSYENIISYNKAEFDKHPEWLAQVNGERKMRGDVKFCVSNPELRKFVANYAVEYFKKNPNADSISMDPSDGGNWCECEACVKMGPISNRVVTLANGVAEAINALGLGDKYVGMYAYNKHCAPPTIKVDPHVIPSATTAFITGGFTFDQVVTGWQAQGAKMGVYDYLSVVDWDWNLPRGAAGSHPLNVASNLVRFHKMGARFYDAESGDCWGPCGLGYYVASRVMWDLNEAQHVDAIIDDFLERSFGPSKVPMREFYRLINLDTQRRSPADLVGRMYRQLDEARKLSSDEKINARINDLILYTRHAELYYAYANSGGKMDDVVRHDYRMRKTMMVHSYGLWARFVGQKAAHDPKYPLKSEDPFTPEELSKILAEGIAKNTPVDPGFVGKEFSKTLVPPAALKLPAVTPGNFPGSSQDHQRYFIWMKEPGSVDLKIKVQKQWANRMPKISLFSPLEVSLAPVATDESYKPDNVENEIKLKTPFPGIHRIETWDGGDYTRIAWPAGLPVTIESGIDTSDTGSHFRGNWSLYFYVPKGTKSVGGWAARVANWAPKVSGKILDGAGKAVYEFNGSDGWFNVPVPEGQDGKLWKFDRSEGLRLLMTVPPYLARTGEELLLPTEVIDSDTKE
jgi:hypothetical protein